MIASSTESTVEQLRNIFRPAKAADFLQRYLQKAVLFSTLLVSIVLTGCSNDKPPPVETEKVESVPRLTFKDKEFEVRIVNGFGSYDEPLTSNPPRYRCTVEIINKTPHTFVKNVVLVDCGSPPQSISFGGGQGSVFYSSADIKLDTPLQPGERRKISFEIEFDAANGGRIPSKSGPSVKSFTDTNGIIFFNTLKFPT